MLRKVYAEAIANTVSDPGLETRTLPEYINMAINLVLGLGAAISIIFLMLGGIQYMTSKGDAKAAETARKWLTNAVIGTIITIGTFALRSMIFGMLGMEGAALNNAQQINGVIDLTP